MAKIQKANKENKKPFLSPFQEYWSKLNYIFLLGGIGVLVIGYVLMAQAPWDGFLSLTLSPIVLLIAYVMIIPLAILVKSSFLKK